MRGITVFKNRWTESVKMDQNTKSYLFLTAILKTQQSQVRCCGDKATAVDLHLHIYDGH